VVTALAGLDTPDARNALALGVGEAMAARTLGAWVSAALLLGLGLGLAMAGASAELPFRASPQGSTASLMFGVVVAVVLAAIALVGALEAHRFFELLTGLPQAPIADRAHLLSQAADDVMRLRPIRQACQALLVTLGGVLLVWQTRRSMNPARGWMGSAFLAAAVAALLMLDSHPMRFAEQGARTAGLGAPSLPANFEPLHMPEVSRPRPLAALVTVEGLTAKAGARIAWSAPTKALADSLSSSLPPSALQAPRPSGVSPEPVLPLLADSRLPGTILRRIIEASALAGARAVELVGQHPTAASPATMARLEAQQPFFSLLAAREGTLQLLLPTALSTRVTFSWYARFDRAGGLLLSPVQGGEALTVSLDASLAEVPEVLAGTFVGLELPEHISLKELGAAARVLELSGASPVVVLDLDSRVARPAHGGTSTLWISPSPGTLAPGVLHWVGEVRRRGLEALRQAQKEDLLRQAPASLSQPVTAAQSHQASSAMAAIRAMAITPTATLPSNLNDAGSFGATSVAGSCDRGEEAVRTGFLAGSGTWVTTEASRSSSPSRASASTRFMWRM
jgi:hypothetical protein